MSEIGLEVLTGLEKLTIHQCEALAKTLDPMEPKRVLFDMCGPRGKLSAYWLDPWMGFFMIEGSEGFNMTRQFEYAPGLWCENVRIGIPTEAAPEKSA